MCILIYEDQFIAISPNSDKSEFASSGLILAKRVCVIFIADIGQLCRVQNIREMLQSVYYNVHVMKKMEM